jgi:rubrerythrin
MKNILVKEMINSISLDSKKHESMLTALLAMQKSTQPFISETVSKELHENIKIHIELEQEAIQTYKELLEQVENKQVKMVIQAIYHDELRHHALLKKIYNVIIEKETLDEDEIWEFIKDDFIPQY